MKRTNSNAFRKTLLCGGTSPTSLSLNATTNRAFSSSTVCSSNSTINTTPQSSREYHSTPINNSSAGANAAGSPLLVPLKYKASELVGRPQKAYELRTYTLNPADYPAFLALTNEKIHMRLKHSKLVGYWTTELGGVNVKKKYSKNNKRSLN